MTVTGIKYGAPMDQLKYYTLIKKCKKCGGILSTSYHMQRSSMPNETNNQDQDSGDGLSITVDDNGNVSIEWDHNDPRWSMFNGWKSEDFLQLISDGITKYDLRHELNHDDI